MNQYMAAQPLARYDRAQHCCAYPGTGDRECYVASGVVNAYAPGNAPHIFAQCSDARQVFADMTPQRQLMRVCCGLTRLPASTNLQRHRLIKNAAQVILVTVTVLPGSDLLVHRRH